MHQNERERFAVLVQAMAATFRQEVTPALLEGYWMGLDDLSLPIVAAAVKSGMRECEFLPTVKEIRTRAAGGGPPYFQSILPEMDRQERCNYHRGEVPGNGPNPDGPVWFCRVCKRLDKPRLGNGHPQPIGELLGSLVDRRLPRERDDD